MPFPSSFFVGDRVRTSLEWPSGDRDLGTIVRLDRAGASIVYTVALDAGPILHFLGFQMHRAFDPERELTN